MADQRPDIVLILTDHWRGDCLGVLDHPVAETPHLDELSAYGTTFTEAYTPCPSCIAARRSMMTGQVPNTHGMVGYCDGKPWAYEHTLAGELARGGYQTINIGKTHFHPSRLHLGFEELVTSEDYSEWIGGRTGLVRPFNAHGIQSNSWMARPNCLPEIEMQETWFTNEAMKRLERRDPTRPFFMTLSFNGPHPPWTPPQVYYDMFINKEMPAPHTGEWSQEHADEAQYPLDVNAWRGVISDGLMQRARAGYFAYLAYLDAQCGRFVEYLGRTGQKKNTWFIFTTDHGEMLGDHNLWRKTYAYDGSARIPFIVKAPESMELKRNLKDDALIGLEDIMPTLLDAAGVPIPDTVEGKSLVPLMKGGDYQRRDYYHHEHSPCYIPENAYQCITTNDWKYVWNPINGREQLFSRPDDPSDCNDLAGDDAKKETLAALRSTMATHLQGRPESFSDGTLLSTGEYPVWRE